VENKDVVRVRLDPAGLSKVRERGRPVVPRLNRSVQLRGDDERHPRQAGEDLQAAADRVHGLAPCRRRRCDDQLQVVDEDKARAVAAHMRTHLRSH